MDALINSSTIVPSIKSIIFKLQVRTKIQRPPPPSTTNTIKIFKAENQQILTFFLFYNYFHTFPERGTFKRSKAPTPPSNIDMGCI